MVFSLTGVYGRSANSPGSYDYGDEGFTGSASSRRDKMGSNGADFEKRGTVSALESISVSGKKSGNSVFQQLNEDKNPAGIMQAAISVDTSSMMLNVNAESTNVGNVGDKRVSAQTTVQETRQVMQSQWNEAKSQASNCLREAAKNLGHDSQDVCDRMVSTEGSSTLAMAGVGVDALLGGGTLSTIAQGACIVREISKQERTKLSPDEIKALLEETVRIAQSSGPKDTRAGPSSGGGGMYGDSPAARSGAKDVGLANLDVDGMKELLSGRFENQPEIVALNALDYKLDGVQGNHGAYADAHESKKIDPVGVVLAGDTVAGYITPPVVAADDVVFVSVRQMPDFPKLVLAPPPQPEYDVHAVLKV